MPSAMMHVYLLSVDVGVFSFAGRYASQCVMC